MSKQPPAPSHPTPDPAALSVLAAADPGYAPSAREVIEQTRLEPTGPAKKPGRTTGLWLFDVVLYNFVNIVVFVMSVGITYLGQAGGTQATDAKTGALLFKAETGKPKYIHGTLGKVIHDRNQKWLVKPLTPIMGEKGAGMASMVFFSFADGTLVAPLVKILEDKREKIARKIDRVLGTEAANEEAYAEEPKQSWGSVIGGRLATASIVLPVAIALSQTWGGDKSLNDKWFNDPGRARGHEIANGEGRLGRYVANHPTLANAFKKLDVPYLFKTVYFEAFYTTVCTLGLYFSSRLFASKDKKKEAEAAATQAEAPQAPVESKAETPVREKTVPTRTQPRDRGPVPAPKEFAARRTAPAGDYRTKIEQDKHAPANPLTI